MIKKLKLNNFRRHEDLTLDFNSDAQIILIAGQNGAGKTSLLESITYALYGHGRYGRKNLDNLVRRGAELEGMEVEMEFEVAGSLHTVTRRRVDGVSTAQLVTNARQVAVGADQVTAEISKIMGMDAVGFKLATVAQQKELDGLAKLGPTVRAQQIRRLLRLEALTAAADEARALFRKERDIATSLAGSVNFKELLLNVETRKEKLKIATETLEESDAAVKSLTKRVEDTSHVETMWSERHLALAEASASEKAAKDEVNRLQKQLDKLTVPPAVVEPEVPMSVLTESITEVERALVRAENSKQMAEQKDMLERELVKATDALAKAKEKVSNLQSQKVDVEELKSQLTTAINLITKEEKALDEERQKHADARSRLKNAETALSKASELTATCSACGQVVTEAHRKTEIQFATVAIAAAKRDCVKSESVIEALRHEIEDAKAAKEKAEASIRQEESRSAEESRALDTVSEVKIRVETYQDRSERIVVEVVDTEDLYARKGELSIKISEAQLAIEQERERSNVLALRDSLNTSLTSAKERYSLSADKVLKAAIDDELKEQYEARKELLSSLNDEKEMLSYWSTAKAVDEKELGYAVATLESAQANEDRRLSHQEKALTAGNASRLLKDVADRLASQIRPALEGGVSQLLDSLSEGRFTRVRIDADYNIRVEDDGKLQPITEFSGGEMDLIALAMRLALAQVVTERHGAGGTGFLILDEVFGSQDEARRESILGALRALKGSYGQILLISHVGGLEEGADMVMSVSRKDGEPSEVKTT